MQVRKALLAVGSLALLLMGGKLALDCKRHVQNRPRPALPAAPDLESRGVNNFARANRPVQTVKIKQATEALRALAELSAPSSQEAPASQPVKSPIAEKFDELKDDPAPAYDHKKIEVRNDEICPDGRYNGRVMAYSGGRFLGYMDFNSTIGGEKYYQIKDEAENNIGYTHHAYRGPWIPFMARSGKTAEMIQFSRTEDRNDIYPNSKDPLNEEGMIDDNIKPIGKFNNSNNSFEDPEGKVLGKLDESTIFVPINLSPLCDSDDLTDRSVAFMRFSNHEEWKAFMIDALKLFPKEMIGSEKGPFSLYYIEDELGLKDVSEIVGPAKFGYDPSIDPE